jgi:nuclear transcription factor Y, gamma
MDLPKNKVEDFWKKTFAAIGTETMLHRETNLPLARIKRLMKVEQEVNKVAAEVPLMFAKLTEIFIEELTIRAWMHTEESKRRIIQRGDICSGAKTSDVFDFLIYLMPMKGSISLCDPAEQRMETSEKRLGQKELMDFPRFQ